MALKDAFNPNYISENLLQAAIASKSTVLLPSSKSP